MTSYWIIKHTPTGAVLPNRGLTSRWTPVAGPGLPPRLFPTQGAARRTAAAWAKGIWEKVIESESDGWEHPSYLVDYPPTPTPVPGRSRDQLEVIRVTLEVNDV